MNYKLKATIRKVEHKKRAVSAKKIGEETIVEYEDLGWYITLDEGLISFYLGKKEPKFYPGQKVNIIISPC